MSIGAQNTTNNTSYVVSNEQTGRSTKIVYAGSGVPASNQTVFSDNPMSTQHFILGDNQTHATSSSSMLDENNFMDIQNSFPHLQRPYQTIAAGQIHQLSNNGSELDKRAHHNALERKRRDHIKESFCSLRDSIPTMRGDKSSRAQILKKASDYIQYMAKKQNSCHRDIDELRAQNEHMEAQIRAIEDSQANNCTDLPDEVLSRVGLNYDLPTPTCLLEATSNTSSAQQFQSFQQQSQAQLPQSLNKERNDVIHVKPLDPASYCSTVISTNGSSGSSVRPSTSKMSSFYSKTPIQGNSNGHPKGVVVSGLSLLSSNKGGVATSVGNINGSSTERNGGMITINSGNSNSGGFSLSSNQHHNISIPINKGATTSQLPSSTCTTSRPNNVVTLRPGQSVLSMNNATGNRSGGGGGGHSSGISLLTSTSQNTTSTSSSNVGQNRVTGLLASTSGIGLGSPSSTIVGSNMITSASSSNNNRSSGIMISKPKISVSSLTSNIKIFGTPASGGGGNISVLNGVQSTAASSITVAPPNKVVVVNGVQPSKSQTSSMNQPMPITVDPPVLKKIKT